MKTLVASLILLSLSFCGCSDNDRPPKAFLLQLTTVDRLVATNQYSAVGTDITGVDLSNVVAAIESARRKKIGTELDWRNPRSWDVDMCSGSNYVGRFSVSHDVFKVEDVEYFGGKGGAMDFWTKLEEMRTARQTLPGTTTLPPQDPPVDDGFDPGILIGVLIFCAVLIVLIGVGIAAGLAFLGFAAIFVTLGVISSSALVALLQRRFSAGLRALHYQFLALVGWPSGIGAWWLTCALFHLQFSMRQILAVGSVIGIVAGIIIAFILDRFFRIIVSRIAH